MPPKKDRKSKDTKELPKMQNAPKPLPGASHSADSKEKAKKKDKLVEDQKRSKSVESKDHKKKRNASQDPPKISRNVNEQPRGRTLKPKVPETEPKAEMFVAPKPKKSIGGDTKRRSVIDGGEGKDKMEQRRKSSLARKQHGPRAANDDKKRVSFLTEQPDPQQLLPQFNQSMQQPQRPTRESMGRRSSKNAVKIEPKRDEKTVQKEEIKVQKNDDVKDSAQSMANMTLTSDPKVLLEREKRKSSQARRSSFYGMHIKKANDKPRSTTNSSCTSTLSNDEMTVTGNFWDSKTIDHLKLDGTNIQCYSIVDKDNTTSLYYTIELDESPVMFQLLKNTLGKDILFVSSNKKFSIIQFHENMEETIYEGKIKDEECWARPVTSYDPVSHTFAFALSSSSINVIWWQNDVPIHKKYNNNLGFIENMVFINSQKDSLELCVQVQKDLNDKYSRSYQVMKCYTNTQKFGNSEEFAAVLHFGHLIGLPAPIEGVLVLNGTFISHVANDAQRTIVTGMFEVLRNKNIKSFCILSSNKVLLLTNENHLFMVRMVVDKEYSVSVVSIHLEKIEHIFKIQNIFSRNEFEVLLQLPHDSWQTVVLNRTTGTSQYTAKRTEDASDEYDYPSPAPIPALEGPASVMKEIGPQVGDVIRGQWKFGAELGRGVFGQINVVQDLLNRNEEFLMKTQMLSVEHESFSNEKKVLKTIKERNNFVGFPKLLDVFEKFDRGFIVMTYEGVSMSMLLNMKKERIFNDTNVRRIGWDIILILDKLHAWGFVHRDLHPGNILFKVIDNRRIQLSVIDFGYSEDIEETKIPKNEMASRHASYNICMQQAYTASDDAYSVTYLMEVMSGIARYATENNTNGKKELIKLKQKFNEDPLIGLPEDKMYIGKLQEVIKINRNSSRMPVAAMKRVINNKTDTILQKIEYKMVGNDIIIL